MNNNNIIIMDIFEAILDQNLQNLQNFVNKKINLNEIYTKTNKNSLLMLAIYSNKQLSVKFLIENNVNINYMNELGMTALNYAIYLENLEIVKYLLKNKAILNNLDLIKDLLNLNFNKKYLFDIIRLLTKNNYLLDLKIIEFIINLNLNSIEYKNLLKFLIIHKKINKNYNENIYKIYLELQIEKNIIENIKNCNQLGNNILKFLY